MKRTPDLRDANESTWAFVSIDRVCSLRGDERGEERIGTKTASYAIPWKGFAVIVLPIGPSVT